jgi:tetratricopeptide (TPR) repeat protein
MALYSFKFIFIFSVFGIFTFNSCSNEAESDVQRFFVKERNDLSAADQLLFLDSALQENPQNIDLLLQKGKLCKELLDFRCALDAGAKAFLLDSTNLEARKLYAWTLINKPDAPLGDIDRARRHYRYILSLEPNNLAIKIELANTYALTGDFEASFKLINDVLRLNDRYRDAYVLKGSNYRVVGNYNLALSSYQTAVQIDPDFFMGHLQTAYLLTEMENHELALEYYRNAADIDPKSLEALYGIAKSLQDLNRFDEAQQAYRNILQIDPDFFIAYFNQGFIKQYYTQELDSAVFYYNAAIDIEPEYVKALHHLGETYFSLDRISDAARMYAKVLTLNPDYEPTLIAKEKLRR